MGSLLKIADLATCYQQLTYLSKQIPHLCRKSWSLKNFGPNNRESCCLATLTSAVHLTRTSASSTSQACQPCRMMTTTTMAILRSHYNNSTSTCMQSTSTRSIRKLLSVIHARWALEASACLHSLRSDRSKTYTTAVHRTLTLSTVSMYSRSRRLFGRSERR